MRRLEPEAPATQISLRLPGSLVKALTARAKRDKVTRSDLCRSLLTAALDDYPSVQGELRAIRDEIKALTAEMRRGKRGRKATR